MEGSFEISGTITGNLFKSEGVRAERAVERFQNSIELLPDSDITVMTENMEIPESLQQRLKACRTLPSVPTVVVEILDLCEEEDVGVSEIAKVLARDPALSAKVLKVSNSAFYGVRSQVTTVDRAISILGINATLSLALSFSFVGALRRAGNGFDHHSYWRRSVITATAAKALSEWTTMKKDELFLAGLLQDLGMLVLNEVVPEEYGAIVKSSGLSHNILVELEREALGTDHAAVGAWMLERWNLPENLKLSVAASHHPELADGSADEKSVRASMLASHIAEIWASPETATATGDARNASIELLDMPAEKFDLVLGEIAAQLPEVTSNLDIDLGGEEMVTRLLDQAREALVILNLQAQRQVRQMQDLAQTDGLTSLFNRAYLEDILPQYFETCMRANRPLSVLFLDIDFFKKINDTYGHQAGDCILISIARILKSTMRTSDIAARYGGEEFVCLLPNTDDQAAKMVGERLRSAIAASPHKVENNLEIGVRASVGCSTLSADSVFQNPSELLELADQCLYAAKRTGRNKVVTPEMLQQCADVSRV
jgi:diguanylate cyclase (GGDEF)-like protein